MSLNMTLIHLELQEAIRLRTEIADVDRNPTSGATELEFILRSSTLATIYRPSAPSAGFTSTQNYTGANSLVLSYQYRIVCTAGTCGSDCTPRDNCVPFPACTPTICADSPCQNGGTCSNVSEVK